MSGSLEVRKFLLQQDDVVPRHRDGVPGQRTGAGEPGRVSPDQVRRAQLSVARLSKSREDCRMLLDMLGLIPDDDGEPPVRR